MEEIIIIDSSHEKQWDQFVENHPDGWLVHLSQWRKVIEGTFPHIKGHCFAIYDSQTKTIKAGLPIYEIKSWLTGNRLVSIPFATISDPLVSSQQETDALCSKSIEMMKNGMFSYIEIRSLKSHNHVQYSGFRINNDYKCHDLDLSIGQEALWKKISYKSIRYLINKAEKHQLTVKVAQTKDDLLNFYHLYAATRKRLGLPAQPYSFFDALDDHFSADGRVSALLAQHNNKVIAGLFLLKFNGRVSAEASGEDPVFRHLGANQFIYWEAIKSACRDGYNIFDFGRTSQHNPTLLDFKRRWGTRQSDFQTSLYDQDQTRIRTTSRETSAPYRVIRFMCHKAPGLIQPALSRFCYRHLG